MRWSRWSMLLALTTMLPAGVALAQPRRDDRRPAPPAGSADRPPDAHKPDGADDAKRPPPRPPANTMPKKGEPGKRHRPEDRPERRKAQRDEERRQVAATTKQKPIDDALRDELQRHAQRIAKLERIADLAESAGNAAALARCEALTTKENARHEAALGGRK